MAKKPVSATTALHAAPVSAMDYPEHDRTYNGFMTLAKWSVILTAVTLVLLYFIVQP